MDSVIRKRYPKKILLTAVIVGVLSLCALIYVYSFKGNLFGWRSSQQEPSSNTGSYDPSTPEQQQSGTGIKSSSINNQSSSSKPSTDTTDTSSVSVDQGSAKASVTLDITSQNQNSSNYQIRTLIGVVTTEGECLLTLTKGGQVVTRTAPVSPLATTTTCQGFDIPLSELSIGLWELTITFTNSTMTGTATKPITIK